MSSDGPGLNDLPQVHDQDAVRDVPDRCQVVTDEQVRETEVALQPLEQVDDLRLQRDIEGGDRLVADEHPRVDR